MTGITAMLPELVLVGFAFLVLVVDLVLQERAKPLLSWLAGVGLVASAGVLILLGYGSEALGGRFVLDEVAWWFKLLFLLAALFTVAISADMLEGRALHKIEGLGWQGEYYSVLLFTVSGMMFLISSTELVSLYVSLELATVPLFALAAWIRGNRLSGEAGLKYVVLGALASAMLLYGLGLLYASAGSTSLDAVRASFALKPLPLLGLALVLVGVGFKLTIVPFHMWAADVYQGAPTPVTAYLSVASKAAGLAFFFQIFLRGIGHFVTEFSPLIAVLAAFTMTLGNTVAIVQQNIKRFMAFSAISQAGYILLGFLGGAPEGVPAMLFYLLVYVLSNMAVFAGIVFYENATGRVNIRDYRGLSRTNPLAALAIMLGLFSLAGVPPFSGFVGKFFLFSIASKAGYHWLVAVAAVNTCISLYYYLRVVRQMYIEPVFEGAKRLPVSPAISVTLAVAGLGAVLVGLIPFFYTAIHSDTVKWLVAFLH